MAESAADPRIAALYQDCQDLARYIARTRAEIATLRPRQLKVEQLPRAGMELDAVVKETEEATHSIMAAAESLMAWQGNVADLAPAIEQACLKIYEACAFQDITGQRVRKVVGTIHHIEERLEKLVQVLGPEMGETREDRPSGDKALLNGPQLAGQGIDQAEVDAMMVDATKAPIAKGAAMPPPTAKAAGGGKSNAAQADVDALFD
ncbi:protein phosphatase CheZ [Desertibaculum subflavum]|uniref:protein phosphatase CheZ n=1 Tax=Desertibaculum subflavum TaxID=2268458 RepID=UPI000E67044F